MPEGRGRGGRRKKGGKRGPREKRGSIPKLGQMLAVAWWEKKKKRKDAHDKSLSIFPLLFRKKERGGLAREGPPPAISPMPTAAQMFLRGKGEGGKGTSGRKRVRRKPSDL